MRKAPIALILAALALTPARASHPSMIYAPVDQPGPALSVPADVLAQSLRCTATVGVSAREAVLFIPPTLVDPDEAWFAFEHAFDDMSIPYCTVTIPHHTTIDIQISAEYVVNAVRTMHERTGRKIQLLGWSQGGGPEPRWALRFWPDVRKMVDDLVDLEAPNHGYPDTTRMMICPVTCVPALWQQAAGSAFIPALNSRQETFDGISYTNVYSHTSQFVQPNLDDTGTTSLHGSAGAIANVALQQVCAADVADHLAYYYDPVAYALTLDALTHDGPADPKRIDPSVCARQTNPYVQLIDVPAYTLYAYDLLFFDRLQNQPRTDAEPPLKCYVTASCAQAIAPGGTVTRT